MRINLGLAALAVLLSTSLWVLVINDQNPERTDTPDISIPVEVTKVPPGLVVMNSLEPVRFKIRAPKDTWNSLRTSSFRAYVDLSHQGPGIQAVPVIPEVSDPQVRVLEVVPSTVSVRLEEIQTKTIPVKVNLVGNVPFGYVYGTPKVDPAVVVASGPASLLQSVQTASVDVRLDGISVEIDSSFQPVAIDSSGNSVRSIQLNPQTVKVQLPVDQQVSYKQVGIRPTITGTVAQGYWIESVGTDPASVTVVGDPKTLAGINYLDTAPLSVDGAYNSIGQEVAVNVPKGVSLVQQQSIRVQVTISSLQTSQMVRVAPRIVNVASGLHVSGSPQYVEVTLQGPAPIMQKLRVDDLAVTVDASGLGEGISSVKPSVTAPSGVSVVSVNPDPVTLMLASASTPTPPPTASPTPAPSPAPGPTPVPTPSSGAAR